MGVGPEPQRLPSRPTRTATCGLEQKRSFSRMGIELFSLWQHDYRAVKNLIIPQWPRLLTLYTSGIYLAFARCPDVQATGNLPPIHGVSYPSCQRKDLFSRAWKLRSAISL